VQNCGINPDFDLFLQRKNGGPSPGQGGVLTRAWLAGAAEPGSSPRVGEKGEELRGPHRGLRWPIRRRGEAGGGEG
jgi:hypothetical protein